MLRAPLRILGILTSAAVARGGPGASAEAAAAGSTDSAPLPGVRRGKLHRMRTGAILAASWAGLAAGPASAAQTVVPTVISVRPHDTSAFTQGLLLYNGWLYESTGMRGESTLREVDPMTGAVRRSVDLADSDFAEGLARVGDRLIQLTWQEQHAWVYDLETLNQTGSHAYTGEGWGLCHDGSRLVMSDGTSTLTFRDPITFASIGSVQVTLDGQPVERLNELECVGTSVYANVWWSDAIVRIDPATGVVVTVIDASGLLAPQEAATANVLNGVAYDATTGRFLVTGKYWPKLFELDFSPQGGADGDDDPGDPAPGGDPHAPATVSSGCDCSAARAFGLPAAATLALVAWRRRRRP